MDQSNNCIAMNVRLRYSRNQNIQNNHTNRHGSSRSRVHRDFSAGVQHQPYVRNSRRQLSSTSTGQQFESRYNLRNLPSNRYARHRNVDHNPNSVNDNHFNIPGQQTDFSNASQLFNFDPDQQQRCSCHNIPFERGLVVNGMTLYPTQSLTTEQEMNHMEEENRRSTIINIHIQLRIDRSQGHDDESPVQEEHVDDHDGSEEEEEPEERRSGNNNLTREIISEYLITRTYNNNYDKNQEEHKICIVCQNEFEEEQVLGCLGCGHEFHADCITRWLLHKNLCPLCNRTALRDNSSNF